MTSHGKRWGLRRLANAGGRFAMLAVDQRPPIAQIVAQARAIDPAAVTFADMCMVKRLLVEELAPHASAVLMDPNFAYPAAIDVLPAARGLILTLEEHRFDETPRGRRTRSIPDWSVEKIKRIGADAVKVLAWYRPDTASDIREHQRSYVREVGRACAAFDIPFVLELLVYPFSGTAGHSSAYEEDPAKHPRRVLESIRAFSGDEYRVDLFKLESPVPAKALPGDDRLEIQSLFDEMGRIAGRPWVMLSAAAPKDVFERVLRYAYRAGAGGFLAGRSVWRDALVAYPDIDACRASLRQESLPYLNSLSEIADRDAKALDLSEQINGNGKEGDFTRSYAPMPKRAKGPQYLP
jgi:tagatose 1,6-diphosphate aldolase